MFFITLLMDKRLFLDKYISQLNEEQKKGVITLNGPVLLLAVPGSGKTTVLVNRLGYMILCEGINPRSILTLTYTVAATNDMRRRFISFFGEEAASDLEFRTINGVCYKIIQQYGKLTGKKPFDVLSDEKEVARILSKIMSEVMEEYPTESDVKGAKTLITYCKNMMLSDDEIKKEGEKARLDLLTIYKAYNKYLKDNGLMDYDDQMVYAYKLLSLSEDLLKYYRNEFKYICVDEAQDTSKIQHKIIRMLAGNDGNLFMVGDEDQSIYGFRAAYPEALLDFEKDYSNATVLVMNKNYRSNSKIVDMADLFIQNNKLRHEKHMVATRGPESDVNFIELKKRFNQYGYLAKVAENCMTETAVLYRDNECAIPLIDILERKRIRYRIRGGDFAFFTHRVVTDVMTIMKFALNPKDTELFMQIYFKCKTYLRKNQAENVCALSKKMNIPVLEAVSYVNNLNPHVKAKCKGLRTNLKKILDESPGQALFRITHAMGYGDYMEDKNLDFDKIFLLTMLAYNENSIQAFLGRVIYLRDMLKESEPDYSCKFILSTIHSSKGLEYDRVYLMDVFDDILPSNTSGGFNFSEKDEQKQYEEERRLFYVGMTRAKDDLNIFTSEDNASTFVDALRRPKRRLVKNAENTVKPKAVIKDRRANVSLDQNISSDYKLKINERVVSDIFGAGSVVIIDEPSNGEYNFTVLFDSGNDKTFRFPLAFRAGMHLENGQNIEIKVKSNPSPISHTKPVIKKKQAVKNIYIDKKKNTYTYWEQNYSNYVVVKKEGSFWTARGESAEILNDILGYKLGGNPDRPMTGSPSLDPIVSALKKTGYDYIVVEDAQIIDSSDGNNL